MEWPGIQPVPQQFGPDPEPSPPPSPMDWALAAPAALRSPDCRDENHRKCDSVAWNLDTDAPDACGCACHEKAPPSQ